MNKLILGYRKFRSHVFPQKRRLYAKLANGQNPEFLLITCSDSRVQPMEFTSANPGDYFSERSIGNLVPLPGTGENEAAAAVEYAVIALKVEHIIICGHTQCGAMRALLDPDSLNGMPTVANWLKSAEETRTAVARKYSHLHGDALLEAAVHENVRVQLEHLKRQSSVIPRLEAGTLKIHGWVFEIEHGRLLNYDANTDEFVPLVDYPSRLKP